jgi:hypothetical protein
MIKNAKVDDLIERVIPNLVDGVSLSFSTPMIQTSSWIMILRKQET